MIKKYIVFILFSMSAVYSQDNIGIVDKSGGLLGVHVGGGLNFNGSCAGSCNGGNGTLSVNSSQLILGLKGGYQYFFNPYFGLRGYAELDYGVSNDNTSTSGSVNNIQDIKTSLLIIGANIDLMAGFAFGEAKRHGIGVVLGLGFGYIDYKNNYIEDNNKFGVPINIGAYYSYENHTIELGAKFISSIKFNSNRNNFRLTGTGAQSWNGSNVIGLLGYSYAF